MIDASRKCLVVAVAAFAACLSACTRWSTDFERIVDESGRDFDRDPGREFRDIDFEAMTITPISYKLMDVRFYALLARHDEKIFLTMYSTFRPEDYYAFALLPIGAPLWTHEGRRSTPTFYIRKDNVDLQKVLDTPRYSVVEVRGRVMGDFDNLPFVDVLYFDRVTSPLYSEDSLADLSRGLEDAAQQRPAPAILELERALQGILDDDARGVAHMALGKLYEARGGIENLERAVENYDMALSYDPENASAAAGLERASKTLEALYAQPR